MNWSSLKRVGVQVFFISLALGLIFHSFSSIGPDGRTQLRITLLAVHLWTLLPAAIIIIASHWIRSLRWQILIEGIGYKTKSPNVFFSLMVGYVANIAVPRVGEFLRCTMVNKVHSDIPQSDLLGTIFVERFVDIVCLLILMLVTLLLEFDLIGVEVMKWVGAVNGFAFFIGIGILIGIGVFLFVLASRMEHSQNRIVRSISHFMIGIKRGVASVRSMKNRNGFLIYTIAMWACYLLATRIGFYGLDGTAHLGWQATYIVLIMGTLAMILTPGGVGAYPLVIMNLLIFLHVSKEVGLAFGWLLWLTQTALILICGAFGYFYILSKSKIKDHATS